MAKDEILSPAEIRQCQLERASRIEKVLKKFEKNLDIGSLREYLDLIRIQEYLLNPTNTLGASPKLDLSNMSIVFKDFVGAQNVASDVSSTDEATPELSSLPGAIVIDRDKIIREIMAAAATARKEYEY
ncbi:MAG: hypothetical protein HQK96_17805 [Nitrospirae bacterium]|nr:hypothetical protein [Nitrospirota bacterium]